MIDKGLVYLILCAAILLQGCGRSTLASPASELCSATSFGSLSYEQQWATIWKCPVERQIDHYLMRSSNTIPPDRTLAIPISEQGDQAVPYILELLATNRGNNDAFYQESLLFLFYVMEDRDFYCVINDSEVMRKLQMEVSLIESGVARSKAENMLEKVREHGVLSPVCIDESH